MSWPGWGTSSQCYGGHGERETPGLIPNPEAKPFSADGTARGTGWESRTPPDITPRNGVTATAVAPFLHVQTQHRPRRRRRSGPAGFRRRTPARYRRRTPAGFRRRTRFGQALGAGARPGCRRRTLVGLSAPLSGPVCGAGPGPPIRRRYGSVEGCSARRCPHRRHSARALSCDADPRALRRAKGPGASSRESAGVGHFGRDGSAAAVRWGGRRTYVVRQPLVEGGHLAPGVAHPIEGRPLVQPVGRFPGPRGVQRPVPGADVVGQPR